MSGRDYYALGDWNCVCSMCGRKRKASEMQKNWQGMWRCPNHNEQRHPQDFVRAVPDIQTPPWVQPPAGQNSTVLCIPLEDTAVTLAAVLLAYTGSAALNGATTVVFMVPDGVTISALSPGATWSTSAAVVLTVFGNISTLTWDVDVELAVNVTGNVTVINNSAGADVTVNRGGTSYSLGTGLYTWTNGVYVLSGIGVTGTITISSDGTIFGFEYVWSGSAWVAYGAVDPSAVNGADIWGIATNDTATGVALISLRGTLTQGFLYSVTIDDVTLYAASASFGVAPALPFDPDQSDISTWTWSTIFSEDTSGTVAMTIFYTP